MNPPKLDDELPEITHGLFNLLWPNYLRPLPASSIIQYAPTSNVTSATTIPRGTLVESMPVDGTRCRFTTIYDVDLLPLCVAGLRLIERDGMAIIALRLALTGGNLQALSLSQLHIHLSGEKNIPYTLYVSLLNRLKELRFVIQDGGRDGEYRENITAVLPSSCVTPLGLHNDEGMLPYPPNTRIGYRIIQEYFCYPDKFLFVRIGGLEQGLSQDVRQRFQTADEFELHFVLDRLPEDYESLSSENLKLFCTPVINLFPFTTPSQKTISENRKHKVTPDPQRPDHLGAYSVEGVFGWDENRKGEERYVNMDFEHQIGNEHATRYRLSVVPTLTGEDAETYITFEKNGQGDTLLRLELLCSNKYLPLRLGQGDICVPTSGAGTAAVPFENILPLSAPHPPPIDDRTLWRLLSNMRLTSIALTNTDALRAVLSAYAMRAVHSQLNRRLLEKHMEGIRAVKSVDADRLFHGFPMRGARTHITLDQTYFSCEGAMYLFCTALNEFLAMYATRNSFHQLIIKEINRGEEYVWPARLGGIPGN